MTYIDGIILPLRDEHLDEYTVGAEKFARKAKEQGALGSFEAIGDGLEHGKVTDFYKAVAAEDGENVVFSFILWPDKATRDKGWEKLMADPEMQPDQMPMPFDAQRMIYAGFDSIIDDRADGRTGYTDGYVLPVPTDKKDAYLAMSRVMADHFKGSGAVRVVEGWGDDVPDGKVTDYKRAVKAEAGETIVYSWVEWPDKGTRDAGWARLMADDPLNNQPMPFDGKRMFWGGFTPILDSKGNPA